MFGIVRRLLGCLAQIWLYVVHTCCRKKHEETGHCDKSDWSGSGPSEDKWETEGWEDFSVRVVPNTEDSEKLSHDQCPGPGDSVSSQQATQQENDLFEDMKPVFRKPKKIHLQSRSSEQQGVNFSKFAVQDSVFHQEVVGELGVWSEDDGGVGWEDGLVPEEGDLVVDSQEALRKKKAYEREKRRKAQEAMRSQQRTSTGNYNSLRLGTRVT